MPRKRKRQKGLERAIRIRKYTELEAFVGAFAERHLNLIILIGAPGLAKSRTAKRILPDACWIEGNASPFGMYLKLYSHRDKVVVIDDVDSLYADRSGIRLLKCLCQTECEKRVAWPSAARELKREGVPQEFVTTSRVVIIRNEWKTLNQNVAALEDRGHTLLFEPSAAEVHRKVSEWFPDKEIFAHVEERLHLLTEPSMRLYHRALELKSAGMDWKQIVPPDADNPRARVALELLLDDSFSTQEGRASEFSARALGAGRRISITFGG